VEFEQALRGLRADRPALVLHHGGEPERLTRSLLGVDVVLATSGVGHDEPDQSGTDDQPDDEQPPIELGVHGRRV
jgi:hypothetical protein